MPLIGNFTPPGDKSISHRVGLLALLAQGACLVDNYSPCADCASTLQAARLLGVDARQTAQGLLLQGAGGRLLPQAQVDCGNSGTTMRLLMGILAGRPGEYVLDGDESLRRRPMERVAQPLRQMGAVVECAQGKPPVRVKGGALKGLEYRLPVASAQLKSAVLLAGIQAEGQTTVWEPVASRDHSERMLEQYGARIERLEGGWRVEQSSLRQPEKLRVPGDASSAAFFLCAAAVIPGSQVVAEGMLLNPTRTGFLRVLERMGAALEIERQGTQPEPWGRVSVSYRGALSGCEVSAQEIPLLVDEVPILALAASQAQGTTVFRQVEELRIKETDRVAAVIDQLGKLGVKASAPGRDLVVEGPTPLKLAGELDSLGDHRIAMTLRLALCLSGDQAKIADEQCASVSYPTFHQDLTGLWRC